MGVAEAVVVRNRSRAGAAVVVALRMAVAEAAGVVFRTRVEAEVAEGFRMAVVVAVAAEGAVRFLF